MFTAGLIQVVYTKKNCLHLALCGHNSSAESTRELCKCSKDSASLIVCSEKDIFLVFGFFVSDVASGILLGYFGPLHLALGPNR